MPYRIMLGCIVSAVQPYELIHALVEQAGGPLRVAKAMGTPGFQPTLHKYCAGHVRSPKRSTAERIANHFKLPIEALYDAKLAEKLSHEMHGLSHWLAADHSPAGLIVPPVAQDVSQSYKYSVPSRRVEVPVRISARPAASGELLVEKEDDAGVVEAALVGPRTYAVKIVGDALYPAMKHGMFVLCDPDAECVPGEPVLLEGLDGSLQLRELVFDRADEITTLSLIGGHRATVSKAQLRRLTAVIGAVYPSRWKSHAATT